MSVLYENVPYLLSFAPSVKGAPCALIEGRGEAGWTVASVRCDEMLAFLEALPKSAWMPGTYRIAARYGVSHG